MFLLPYADETLVSAALDSPVSWDRAGVDRFLSTLSLEWGEDYQGEPDFGTLTRIELDDELRVVCVLLEMVVADRSDEASLANLVSHYRADVVLGEGSDQRWWADWYLHSSDRAAEIWSKFSDEYGAWLGDDDDATSPECEIHPGRPHETASLSCELYSQELLTTQDDDDDEPTIDPAEYGFRGFVWSEYEDNEPADGGSRIWCSSVREARGNETADYYEVPLTVWGDYVGSTVERSNYRSLIRDYPETFVEVGYGYNGHSLLIPAASLTEELATIFTGLGDYPVYDEEDLSELETELTYESWDAYVRFDLVSDLRRHLGDAVDDIPEDELRERFFAAVRESDQAPYAETADNIIFPMWDDIVSALADYYGKA